MGKFLHKRTEIPVIQSEENPDIYITLSDLAYVTDKNEYIYIKAGYMI